MERAPLIRPLNPADRDAFFHLRLRALLKRRYARAEGDFVLGAFAAVDQPLIGVVRLMRNQRLKERHKASVVGMYVAPEAAGRGVGRALLTELLARADRVDGLRQIQLVVSSKNDAARHLYESVGFRCYGREIEGLCVGGAFYDADLMARFI